MTKIIKIYKLLLTGKDKYRHRGGLKSSRYAKLLTSGLKGQEARRAFYRRPREKLLLSLRKNTRHFHILSSFLNLFSLYLIIKIIMKFEKNTLLNPLWELLDRLAQSIGWVVGGHLDLKMLKV